MLIAVICELILYFILISLPPEAVGFDILKVLLYVFCAALGFSVFGYLGPYFAKSYRITYAVSSKWFECQGLHRWKNIISCKPPQQHEELEDVLCMQVEMNCYMEPQNLILSKTQSDLANNVYDYIQQKISEQDCSTAKKHPWLKLSKMQHIKMLTLSLVTVAVLSFMPFSECFVSFSDFCDSYPWTAILIIFLFLFLGPGTWGIILLCKVRPLKYRGAIGLMFSYNFLTVLLVSTIKKAVIVYSWLEIL